MSQETHTFFVTGASGGQGGAVARQLLAAGHRVHALVRNPEKAALQELAKAGATLIQGDYDDEAALEKAAQDCYGVFINTLPTKPSEIELGHVTKILAAARQAGIKHVVYSSVTRAEEHESFPGWDPNGFQAGYWRAKAKIQEMVQRAGFESWTVLQPAWIMTNWIAPVSKWYWPELAREKILLTAFAGDTEVHLTDPGDIGRFAVKALTSSGGDLDGIIVKVAGDAITIREIAEEMTKVGGVPVHAKIRTDEEIQRLKNSNPFVSSQLWQRLSGSQVDLQKVKGFGIPLTSFREFLEANKEALLDAFQI